MALKKLVPRLCLGTHCLEAPASRADGEGGPSR